MSQRPILEQNSTTIKILSPGDTITPIPLKDGLPDWNAISIGEPSLSILKGIYEANKSTITIVEDLPTPIVNLSIADPKGFYEKMIGVMGDNPLYTVYQQIIQAGLDPNTDTSSLNFAVTIFNGALNINDWTKPYAKPAYLQAYTILKTFLSPEQIEIIDSENTLFNLI